MKWTSSGPPPPLFICGEADRSGRGRCCSCCCCCCCCCCWGIWGDCFPFSHVHSKWVHSEKTFLQNGCIQRKLFFKMGASRENFVFFKMGVSKENFSSKWVLPEKTFLQNGCIHEKLLLQNSCIKTKLYFKMGASSPFLLQNLEKDLFCLLKSLFMP